MYVIGKSRQNSFESVYVDLTIQLHLHSPIMTPLTKTKWRYFSYGYINLFEEAENFLGLKGAVGTSVTHHTNCSNLPPISVYSDLIFQFLAVEPQLLKSWKWSIVCVCFLFLLCIMYPYTLIFILHFLFTLLYRLYNRDVTHSYRLLE